ncbi:hypothetical protein ACGF8D_10785 [Streptomyces massasporeus]|uniref:hypothetical protein n=1 Tax=Streptomyces massasporeus TaxID=67324 RepID=UPI00371BAF17
MSATGSHPAVRLKQDHRTLRKSGQLTTGALSNHVIEQADRVWSAAWSPLDDRLAISTNDGVFRLLLDNQASAFDHRGPVVESIAWSPGASRIATGDNDGTVRV